MSIEASVTSVLILVAGRRVQVMQDEDRVLGSNGRLVWYSCPAADANAETRIVTAIVSARRRRSDVVRRCEVFCERPMGNLNRQQHAGARKARCIGRVRVSKTKTGSRYTAQVKTGNGTRMAQL